VGPSTGRYLAARAALGGAVAAILALPAARAPQGLPLSVLTLVLVTSASGLLLLRFRPGWGRHILAATLGLDLAVESLLVGSTGAGRSPFVLLFSLSVAASGLFFGLLGSMGVAAGAVGGYWWGIVETGEPIAWAPLLTSFFLLFLGFLAGMLGRRIAVKSREVDRVRGELERVLLDAETIVASIGTPLLCLDRAGTVRRANRALAALLGADDLEGRSFSEIGVSPRLRPLVGFIEETKAADRDACREILLPASSGSPEVPVEVLVSCVRDRSGLSQGLVLLLRDLTSRKREEAEQARRERLACIGELSGHLAHEIRNTLKPVVGSIELLAGEIPLQGTAGELLEIILKESESLESFLTDFLSYTRDKSLTIEDVDLDDLLGSEVAAVRMHPARRPDVVVRAGGGAPGASVQTDRAMLSAALRNLLINALEATQAGRVEVSWSVEGERLEIAVSDTGVGLPDGDPEALFEPFCSHKPGGTGLGLSIARRLARRLGGDVILEPRAGGGARARLALPPASGGLKAA